MCALTPCLEQITIQRSAVQCALLSLNNADIMRHGRARSYNPHQDLKLSLKDRRLNNKINDSQQVRKVTEFENVPH
jgi:hypothetical protein